MYIASVFNILQRCDAGRLVGRFYVTDNSSKRNVFILQSFRCGSHHRCMSKQIFGGAKDFCPNVPNLPENILIQSLCEYFLTKTAFQMTSKKKVFMWFWAPFFQIKKSWAPCFSNQSTLGAIFARIFREFFKIFRDFAKVFRYFAQMFRAFVLIFRYFSRIFTKSTLLGRACTNFCWISIYCKYNMEKLSTFCITKEIQSADKTFNTEIPISVPLIK